MIRKIILLNTIVFSCFILAQTKSNKLTIIGDSLKGKIVNNESIREIIGNVIITQDDVRITCNKAIQSISNNSAQLIGNVILVQDSIVIKTEKGNYYGNQKLTVSDTTVYLKNKSLNLTADHGRYDLNTKIAQFFGNVIFYDSVKTLKSIKLDYFKEEEKVIAVGKVSAFDSLSVILADSLIHFRKTQLTKGFKNVVIKNSENNVSISGEELFDDKENGVSKIYGNPFLTQIEELSNGTFDTLFIQSKYMEANKLDKSKLIATDSVRVIRGDFFSNNDFTIYDQEVDQITIIKQKDKKTPILWYENTQVTGDTIYIKLDSNKIKSVEIYTNSILISEDSLYSFRFNQMSGDSTILNFSEGSMSETIVNGKVLSIYYLYEEEEANGLLKSSADQIKILFSESKVTDVKMYGNPESEYHPENLVKGNEKEFTLPSFVVYKEKPDKNKFKLMSLKQNLE